MKKAPKKPKKQASSSVGEDQLSDNMKKPEPQREDRGIGSSFATAVANAIVEGKAQKGSQNAFLGVEAIILDPKEVVSAKPYSKTKEK